MYNHNENSVINHHNHINPNPYYPFFHGYILKAPFQ